MLCNNCEQAIEIENKDNICQENVAVKYNNTYICLPCSDVLSFFDNNPKIKTTKINKKENLTSNQKKATTSYLCNKCKKNYTGEKCNFCGMLNPLFIRK